MDKPLYYTQLLTQHIRDKLAMYLLEGRHQGDLLNNCSHRAIMLPTVRSDFLITRIPIKNIAVANWLSPGYHRNIATAKRTRRVTGILANERDTDLAYKEIAAIDDFDMEREKKRKVGCSCSFRNCWCGKGVGIPGVKRCKLSDSSEFIYPPAY